MAVVKQVTLKDPKTGDYLSPRVFGAIEYEVQESGVEPPYDELSDAATLEGHPASDFALANHGHTTEQISGLAEALNEKANTTHTHTASQITDLSTTLQQLESKIKSDIQTDISSSIPKGLIAIWSGNESDIPSGWHLCDGNEGTPDLRDKFVLGAGTKHTIKTSGGEEEHTLTQAEMPAHTHAFSGTPHNHVATLNLSNLKTDTATDNHTHTYTWGTGSFGGSGNGIAEGRDNGTAEDTRYAQTSAANSSHSHTITGTGGVTINNATAGGTNASAGGSTPHNNMPPFYALAYIMKV